MPAPGTPSSRKRAASRLSSGPRVDQLEEAALLRSIRALAPRLESALKLQAIAELGALLLAAALFSFFVDRWLHIPWPLRLFALVALVFGGWRLVQRAKTRVREYSTDELAAAVERYDSDLDGHLMNALHLSEERDRLDSEPATGPLERQLLEHAIYESRRATRGTSVGRSLDLNRVRLWVLTSVVLLGLAAVTAQAFRHDVGTWFQRNVLLFPTEWPRRTRIVLEDDRDTWHVARAESLELRAWVVGDVPEDLTLIREAAGEERSRRLIPEPIAPLPGSVLAAIETHEADSGESHLARDVRAALAQDPSGSRVRVQTESLTDSFSFVFRGGDAETSPVRVEVHDRPQIVSVAFALEYPEYLRRTADRIVDPAGEVIVPLGTQITVEVEADMPIGSGVVAFEEAPLETVSVEGSKVTARFSPVTSSTLELSVRSAEWDLESRPTRLVPVVVLPDEPPVVTLHIDEASRVATPNGRIVLSMTAEDDHGFSTGVLRRWTRYAGETLPDEELPLVETPIRWTPDELVRREGGISLEKEWTIDVASMQLIPGSRILFQVAIADNDALHASGPKSAESQLESVLVVDPDKLREEAEKARVEMREKIGELAAREMAAADLVGEIAGTTGEVRDDGNRATGANSNRTNQTGEQQSGEQQSGQQQSGEQQSGQQQSGEQQSGQQQSGEQQSGQQQSGQQQSGEQQSGEQQSGEQQSGEQQSGEQQSGEQQSGQQQSGQQQSGQQQSGQQQSGQQQSGEQQSGEQQSGQQQSGQQQSGQQQSGQQQSGQQQSGQQQSGQQQSGEQQSGQQQSGQQQSGQQQSGQQQSGQQQSGEQQSGQQQSGQQQSGQQQSGQQQSGQQQSGQQQSGQQQSGQQQSGQQQSGQQQSGQQQSGQQQSGQQQSGQQQSGQQQSGQQQSGQQQSGQQQSGQQQSGQQQSGEQQSGQQQSGQQQSGQQQSGEQQTQDPSATIRRIADSLLAEQQAIQEEAESLSTRHDRMVRMLRNNRLMDEGEEERIQDEVAEPLKEIIDDRLPQIAEDISKLPESASPSADAFAIEGDLRSVADDLKTVAENLAGTGDLDEIIQRMELLLQLQRQAIEKTEGSTKR